MGAEFFSSDPPRPIDFPGKAAAKLRRAHRWVATLFLLTVAANFIAMIAGKPPAWITYAPLPPLFVLMGSGLVMLVTPLLHGRRGKPGNKGTTL